MPQDYRRTPASRITAAVSSLLLIGSVRDLVLFASRTQWTWRHEYKGGLWSQRRGATAFVPWLVGLSCLALSGLADAVLAHERGVSGDEPFYMRMASHPGAAHSFPYAYRIAVPWVVHVLPFAQIVNFQVVTLVCIGVGGAALYVLLADFAIPAGLAWALALGFAISPNLLVVLLRHGRSIDPATTLVMILGALFIVRRQKLALTLTILVGVAVKETSLFLILSCPRSRGHGMT